MNKVTNKKHKYTVAIVGIPNVGKSVIFNKLTGGKAWVGNWPGVTVEKKVGRFRADELNAEIEVVDLPGIYSLTAYSVDELIARNFIIEEKPDVVVVIANAANLERSLYLILSMMELGANVVVALNMIDIARSEGYEVLHDKLKQVLGIPVIPTIAVSNVGIEELRKSIINSIKRKVSRARIVSYGKELERIISRMEEILTESSPELTNRYPSRLLVIKFLEGDEDITSKIRRYVSSPILDELMKLRRKAEEIVGDVEEYITEVKFKRAMEIARLVTRQISLTAKINLTDILDTILTHKVLGIPLALSIMYLLFRFAFDLSAPLSDGIDVLINGILKDWIKSLKFLPIWLTSLLADGIIAGVGAVLVFLPVIAFFFFVLSILEDIGYLARLAFVIDKILHKFKLPGKSIIPLIMGFGCNVPAVLATRAIEDEKDRKVTALIAPLSSCSARLPVYLTIAGAVMGAYAAAAVTSMYWLSIILALSVGLLFRSTILRGPTTGFIMELPPYLAPRIDNVLMKTWERTKHFLIKAGTVIFLGVVIVWLLSITGPTGYLGPEALENPDILSKSWIGFLGKVFSIFTSPMGWDWRTTAALIFGFIAKEIIVGSLGVLLGTSEESLREVLSHIFTPLSGFTYMIFVLVYVPCIATLAGIRSELGLKYAIITALYQVILAYILALLITILGGIIMG